MYDVTVLGAGPAGSIAAHQAARKGLRVLLVDRARFPREKACGGCLHGRAVELLGAMGLGPVLDEVGARALDGVSIHAPDRRASLALSGSVSISRRLLDAALVRHATNAGATFIDGTSGRLAAAEESCRVVELERSEGIEAIRSRLVLVADGLAGTALRGLSEHEGHVARRSRVGFAAVLPPDRSRCSRREITLAIGRHGYVGMVGLADGSLDLAAALDREQVGVETVAEILDGAGLSRPHGLREARWRGTPELSRHRSRIAGERFFVLGDAAGYVEPFTGEGMTWAIEGASLVSELIVSAVRDWHPSWARRWHRIHRRRIRQRQWVCRAVTQTLRRPTWTKMALSMLNRTPHLAAPLLRRLDIVR